jgi:HAD superfamily hydrolase (TIGR01490 family)
MGNLALFDFDGTITRADTFKPFILHAVLPMRMALGQLVLSPVIAGYKLGVVSASRMRRSAVQVGLRGRRAADVRAAGLEYSRTRLAGVVRDNALERIRWHQTQGDTVVVVSASLDVYLSDWCNALGVDLICTELEQVRGVLTGGFLGGDCSGEEKARRVRSRYTLKEYAEIYAYGDTPEDEAMLALATRRYYRWRERPRATGELRTASRL